jgi:hypothetical protein
MLLVPLFPGLPGGSWARLGPLTGAIEEDVDPDDPEAFGRLVNRLLQPHEGTTVGPGCAQDLTVTDLDRIAVMLYRRHFGDRIETRVTCRQCGHPFEASLDLPGLPLPTAIPPQVDVTGPDGEGTFVCSKSGRSFRLPTLRDQLATQWLAPSTARRMLAERCTGSRDLDESDLPTLEDAMESVGPLLSGRIAAACPHCRFEGNQLQFAIQQILVDALASERRFLFHEVHTVARAYGWSRTEILSLARDDRGRHVRMVLAERGIA